MAAWTEAYSGSATIGVTEFSLTNNSTVIASQTAKGTYQAVVRLANMVAGDQYEIRALEKCRAGDPQESALVAIVTGAQTDLWVSPALMLGNGWDVTVKKLAGTDRAIAWSIRAYA